VVEVQVLTLDQAQPQVVKVQMVVVEVEEPLEDVMQPHLVQDQEEQVMYLMLIQIKVVLVVMVLMTLVVVEVEQQLQVVMEDLMVELEVQVHLIQF
tara:strand:- start:161 stop:448 length:288 start_codon:yes stop_codon:yes gene_type:complete